MLGNELINSERFLREYYKTGVLIFFLDNSGKYVSINFKVKSENLSQKNINKM